MPSRSLNDMSKLFNKFAGCEVPLNEKEEVLKTNIGNLRHIKVTLTDPSDPTVREMEKLAQDNGLELRLIYPGSGATDDRRLDRVNASLEKAPD